VKAWFYRDNCSNVVGLAAVYLMEGYPDAAESLAQLLDPLGCEVAHDGRSALALAKAKRPDLVLCNLGLPGNIDGFAVVRAARADEQLQ
jgi:CheY-like chemotaxis protein